MQNVNPHFENKLQFFVKKLKKSPRLRPDGTIRPVCSVALPAAGEYCNQALVGAALWELWELWEL